MILFARPSDKSVNFRALFTYFVVQAAIAAFLSWRTVSAKVAADEGVIYTAEPIVAPLVFGAGYCFLLYRMQDILYLS